jgi:hypothetical protein
MAKKQNVEQAATEVAEVVNAVPKRGKGRPAAFPDQETVVRGANLPVETWNGVRTLVREGETLNQTLNRVLTAAIASEAKRAAKRSTAKA